MWLKEQQKNLKITMDNKKLITKKILNILIIIKKGPNNKKISNTIMTIPSIVGSMFIIGRLNSTKIGDINQIIFK